MSPVMLLTVPNDDSGILLSLGVAGLKRTWAQKLSSGLLLKFMTTQLFHFRFAVAEQCRFPCGRDVCGHFRIFPDFPGTKKFKNSPLG